MEHVDPTSECHYPGIHDLCTQHKTWLWIYGKTPKFSVEKSFHNPQTGAKLHLRLVIEKGLIIEAELTGDIDSQSLDIVRSCVLDSKVWPRDEHEEETLVKRSRTSEERDLLLWISRCLHHIL